MCLELNKFRFMCALGERTLFIDYSREIIRKDVSWMRKAVCVLASTVLMILLLVFAAGCGAADDSQSSSDQSEAEPSKSEIVYVEESSDKKDYEDAKYYRKSNVPDGYSIPGVCPFFAYLAPYGYEVIEEASELRESSWGIWWATLYNSQKGTYLHISYIHWWKTDEYGHPNAFGELSEEAKSIENIRELVQEYKASIIEASTESYTIYRALSDTEMIAMPKDSENIVGGIAISYNEFYVNGEYRKFSNVDEAGALDIAKSLLPSKLTYEEYKKVIPNPTIDQY